MTSHRFNRARKAGLAAIAVAALALAAPLGSTAATAMDAVDGLPSIGDSLFSGIGNTGYDALNYDVDLQYFEDGTVSATTTMTASASAPLRSFSLDFEGMLVDSVTVNGEATTFSRIVDPSAISFKLLITPVTPVPAGEFTVEVKYSGTPTTHVDPDGSFEGWVPTPDGATALGQPVGTMTWIPSNNTPADKATYDFAFTIPTKINGQDAAAVGNGELISHDANDDGTTTWVWKQQRQMSTMATMVSIGNYVMYESEVELTSGQMIPEWSFVDVSITPTIQNTINTRRGQLEGIIQFLETKYGPYPGGSTGIVVDVTNLGYALETQDRSYFERNVSESTLVHELAHQWFGDAVTPRDWNSIWVSEGMATYASNMYSQEVNGGTSTLDNQHSAWQQTAATSSRWATPTGAMTDPADLFNWQVYNRGAMTYEALKQALTPEVFDELLIEWNARNTGTSQTTTEFRALAEELSGKDLEAFFQDWIFDADKPAWPVTWDLSLGSNPATGEVAPGESVTYTLTAASTGKLPLTGGTATVDVASLLESASIDASTLTAGLSLDGGVLTWAVPETALGEVSTAEFTALIGVRSHDAEITVSTSTQNLGVTLGETSVTHTTPKLPAVTESDLSESARGGLVVPAKATPGDTIELTLPSDDYAGEQLSTLMFSAPRDLGATAVNGATLTVTVPADAPLGAHRLAVVSAQNELIGWGDIALAPANSVPPVEPTDPADPVQPTEPGGDVSPKTPSNEALASTGGLSLTPLLFGGVGVVALAGLLLVAGAARNKRRNAVTSVATDSGSNASQY